jgi:hypothetical protein
MIAKFFNIALRAVGSVARAKTRLAAVTDIRKDFKGQTILTIWHGPYDLYYLNMSTEQLQLGDWSDCDEFVVADMADVRRELAKYDI